MAFDFSARKFSVKSMFQALGVSAVLLVAFASSASAVTIISGSANVTGNVTFTPTTIQFFNGATPNIFGPNGSSTGSFAGLTGGTIQELFLATEPVGTAIDVIDYATFLGGLVTPIDFDLTYIQPGTGTNAACSLSAVNTICTPTGSPLTFIQQAGQVAILLTLDGVAYPAAGGSAASGSSTAGGFTSQVTFAGVTIPQVIAMLGTPGSIGGQSYSATFAATPTPEPSTGICLLFGTVLVGMSLARRRPL